MIPCVSERISGLADRVLRWLSIFLLSFLGATPGFAEGPRIMGRVMDGEAPSVESWVELTPLVGRWQLGDLLFQGKTRPEPVARTTTGTDGRFALRAPDVGMWRLTVGGAGRVPVQISLVPLYRDVELPDADLGPDHGLTVRVVDRVGRPLARAAVLAYSTSQGRLGRNGLPSPVWQRATELVFTGEDGRAQLRGRRGETLRLQVAEPDHPSAMAEVRLPVSGELEVPLARGRRVTLRVASTTGTPIPDALVWAGEEPFPIGWTGIEGLTSVVLSRRGPVPLLALDGSGGRSAYELSTSSKVESVRLPFRAPAAHAGRVLRRGTQEPVAGALVWSWYRPDRFVRSDTDGRFRLAAVDPGGYLSAVRAGYLPAGLRLEESRLGKAQDATVLQLQPVGRLSGLVVDAAGEPVAGLGLSPRRLSVAWRANSTWPFRTESDGTFALPDLPAEAELLVELGGMDDAGTLWAQTIEKIEPLAPGEDRTGVILHADRGFTAFGWVVDEGEAPVAGAVVRLVNADPARRALQLPALPARDARTDEVGRWEMSAFQGKVFDLEARARGYAPMVVPGIELESEREDLGAVDLGTVVLTRGRNLVGTVLDPDRRPVAGAEVSARETGRSGLATRSTTVSDDAGRFVLRDLRGGARVAVLADHPEFLAARVEPVTVPSDEADGGSGDEVTIVLERGTSVLGRVTDEAGRPVARAGVAIFAQGGGGSARGGQSTASTDEQGDFALHHVPGGPATLQVSHRDYPRHSEPVQLLPPHLGPTQVDIVLRGADGSLRGQIRDERGEPVAAAMVLLPGDGILRSASAHTDAEGGFQVVNVDAGLREVVVHHAAFASYRTEIEVDSNSWLDVELRSGVSVSGRVVDGNGDPVAGARIDTTPIGEAGQATREGAVSAADGSFTVERLVPGRYLLGARVAGYYAPQEPEPLVLDGDLDGVTLEVRRGVTLEGRVVGADFDELASLKIFARHVNSDGRISPLQADVDFEGGFRLDGLSPGTWRVSVGLMTLGGPRSAEVVVESGRSPEPVVLRLGDGFKIRGTLRIYGEPAGWSAGMVRVILRSTGDQVGVSMRFIERGDRFEFDDVPGGVYEASVGSSSGRLWHREIEVQGDMDLDIEARVASLAGTVRDGAGRPLGDVQVLLFGTSPVTEGGSGETLISSSTGEDGRFRIEVLPTGDYNLQLQRNGFRHEAQPLSFVQGVGLDLELVMIATGR